MSQNNVIKSLSILSVLGAMAYVGYSFYQRGHKLRVRKVIDKKLDLALEQSMDCSDATASY